MSKDVADMIFAVAFVQLSGNLRKLYTEKILTQRQFSLVVAGQAEDIKQMYLAGLGAPEQKEKPLKVQVSEGLGNFDPKTEKEIEDFDKEYAQNTFSEEMFDIWNDNSVRTREQAMTRILEIGIDNSDYGWTSVPEMFKGWEIKNGAYFPEADSFREYKAQLELKMIDFTEMNLSMSKLRSCDYWLAKPV